MTQPTQSDSLHIMGQCHCEPFMDCWYWVNVKDLGDAKDADTQLHKRQYKAIAAHYAAKEQEAVLRARIDELEKIPILGNTSMPDVITGYARERDIINRLATLTNQLNQMKRRLLDMSKLDGFSIAKDGVEAAFKSPALLAHFKPNIFMPIMFMRKPSWMTDEQFKLVVEDVSSQNKGLSEETVKVLEQL